MPPPLEAETSRDASGACAAGMGGGGMHGGMTMVLYCIHDMPFILQWNLFHCHAQEGAQVNARISAHNL